MTFLICKAENGYTVKAEDGTFYVFFDFWEMSKWLQERLES